MTKQARRRRKRYQPGSAYAGDVRPRGVFRVFGNVRLFFITGAAIMVGSLFVGGILRSGALLGGSTTSKPTYVLPTNPSSTGTPPAQPTIQVKHYSSPPALTIDPSKHYTATITTSLGAIQVELFAAQAPQTVNNFVFLANDGFYNGLTFYQVQAAFDAQAGDPTCQAKAPAGSCRGTGDPGYSITPERPATPVAYQAGTIGMANASQFFIALTSASQFAQYTPLGRITSGLDVAQRITPGTGIDSITIQAQ